MACLGLRGLINKSSALLNVNYNLKECTPDFKIKSEFQYSTQNVNI